MYAGFRLELNAEDLTRLFYSESECISESYLSKQKDIMSKSLEQFITEGTDLINGSLIEKEWFPQIEADIFISHSHRDIDLVQKLAGWIYSEFGLKCFVDSNVWGFCDELAELLNSKYSNKRPYNGDGFLYDYSSCLDVSKHVNTMLTLALYKMVDRTEILLFLNTPNSIKPYENNEQESSKSPWIYSELMCSEIVRRKVPHRRRFLLEHQDRYSHDSKGANISYDVPIKHLFPLNIDILQRWKNSFQERNDMHALDVLYDILLTSKNL